jgi:hypothetical protein
MKETIIGALKLLWVCLGSLVYMGFSHSQQARWGWAILSWALGASLLLWWSYNLRCGGFPWTGGGRRP